VEHGLSELDEPEVVAIVDASARRGRDPVPHPSVGLQEVGAQGWNPAVSDLARHWAVAAVVGERTRAAGWIRRAADEAMRRLAYEEAARLFRQTLDIGGPELDGEDRCALLLAAGAAAHLSADLGGRLDACLEAAELARALGRPDMLSEAVLVMEPVGRPGYDLATRRLCQEAIAALGSSPTLLRARVTARLAESSAYLRELDPARPASEQALALAEQSGDPLAVAAALRARQLVLGPRRPRRSREAGRPHAGVGSPDPADRCRGLGPPVADEAFAVMAPSGQPGPYAVRAAIANLVGRHVGQDDASVAANNLIGVSEEIHESFGLIGSLSYAHAVVTAGRPEEAAEVYRSLGLSAETEALYGRLDRFRGHHVVSGAGAVAYYGPVELWLGIAAHHLGRLDAAVTDLERAARTCEHNGAVGFRVEANLELAAALARRSRPGDANGPDHLPCVRPNRPPPWA
jgi:hypothetical protein